MIPVTSPQTLGKVLRRYRKNRNLSQSEVGRKFNISQKVVSNIESGRPGIHIVTIFRYMSALGLEMQLETRDKSLNYDMTW
jgi:HTH-type transcriptional regulator/antitoxin HipB